jgi:hypothetical protein
MNLNKLFIMFKLVDKQYQLNGFIPCPHKSLACIEWRSYPKREGVMLLQGAMLSMQVKNLTMRHQSYKISLNDITKYLMNQKDFHLRDKWISGPTSIHQILDSIGTLTNRR